MDGFEEFVRARSAALAHTAYLLTGDRHAAEDLLQNTLARVAVMVAADRPGAADRRGAADRPLARVVRRHRQAADGLAEPPASTANRQQE